MYLLNNVAEKDKIVCLDTSGFEYVNCLLFGQQGWLGAKLTAAAQHHMKAVTHICRKVQNSSVGFSFYSMHMAFGLSCKSKIISGTNINLGSSESRKSCSPLWLMRGFWISLDKVFRSSSSPSHLISLRSSVWLIYEVCTVWHFQYCFDTASSRKEKPNTQNNIRLNPSTSIS